MQPIMSTYFPYYFHGHVALEKKINANLCVHDWETFVLDVLFEGAKI